MSRPGRSSRPTRHLVAGSALLLTAASAAGGCGSEATSGGAVCVYGLTIPCTGEGGCEGRATCLPDLTGYGPCVCPGPDGSADAGRDADRMDGSDAGEAGASTDASAS